VPPSGTTPLLAAVTGEHALVEAFGGHNAGRFAQRAAGYRRVIAALVEAGASAGDTCPLLDAIVFRSQATARQLLKAMNASEVTFCLTAQDSLGGTVWHAAASSASAGFSRLFARARQLLCQPSASGRGQAPDVRDAIGGWLRHLGLNATALLAVECADAAAVAVVTRDALEAASGAREITLLLKHATAVGVNMTWVMQAVDASNRTVLDFACMEGRVAVVSQLAAAGWPVTWQVRVPIRPLHPLARSHPPP
jgi:ankyrin repeat protein